MHTPLCQVLFGVLGKGWKEPCLASLPQLWCCPGFWNDRTQVNPNPSPQGSLRSGEQTVAAQLSDPTRFTGFQNKGLGISLAFQILSWSLICFNLPSAQIFSRALFAPLHQRAKNYEFDSIFTKQGESKAQLSVHLWSTVWGLGFFCCLLMSFSLLSVK